MLTIRRDGSDFSIVIGVAVSLAPMTADGPDMARSYDLPEKRPFITTAMVLTVGVLLAASAGLLVVVWALCKIAVNPGS